MKRNTAFPFARHAFWIAAALLIAGSARAAVDTLVVLHTNDFHGYIAADGYRAAGLARIAAYFDRERARGARVLALDAGDCVSGTPVSILFKGRPIFEVMSAAGYDAVALGNHEFDYGWREIPAYRELAEFPLLSANARDPAGNLVADAPSAVLERSGLKVGVVGVTTQRTAQITTTVGNQGISFDGEIAAVGAEVASLRKRVDVLILLSHAGHEADSLLAESVDGIDLIVSGHTHGVVAPPQFVRGTPIVRAGAYTSHVGHVTLLYDRDAKKVRGVDGYVVAAADLPAPDPEVAAVVAKWEDRVSALVDVAIGRTGRDWTRDETHLLIEHILAEQAGTDFGYYNRGGIRNMLYKGDITARHIWNIHPFGNRLATVYIRGGHIGGALAERLRARAIRLDPDRQYAVATNSFVAEAARRQSQLGAVDSVYIADVLVRDAVMDYIKAGAAVDAVVE